MPQLQSPYGVLLYFESSTIFIFIFLKARRFLLLVKDHVKCHCVSRNLVFFFRKQLFSTIVNSYFFFFSSCMLSVCIVNQKRLDSKKSGFITLLDALRFASYASLLFCYNNVNTKLLFAVNVRESSLSSFMTVSSFTILCKCYKTQP